MNCYAVADDSPKAKEISMTQLLAQNWAAVLLLQKKLAQHLNSSNSFEEHVYDNAINLALNRLDTDSTFLAHNCYRHAKTTISRRRKNTLLTQDYDVDVNYLDCSSPLLCHQLNNEILINKIFILAHNAGIKTFGCILDWHQGLSIEESTRMRKTSILAIKKLRQRFKEKISKEECEHDFIR